MLAPLSTSIDSLDENFFHAEQWDEFIYLCGVKFCCFSCGKWMEFLRSYFLADKISIESVTAVFPRISKALQFRWGSDRNSFVVLFIFIAVELLWKLLIHEWRRHDLLFLIGFFPFGKSFSASSIRHRIPKPIPFEDSHHFNISC